MEEESPNNQKGFLNRIEKIGNKLPHPVILFVILAFIVIIISEIAFRLDLSAVYFDSQTAENVTVYSNSLMNKEGIRYIFNSSITNFTGFAPLGTVLVTMLGVGVAESTGLISTGLKRLIQSVPDSLLTMVVVFAGVMSSIASDAGYVVVIPLGAIVFASSWAPSNRRFSCSFCGCILWFLG